MLCLQYKNAYSLYLLKNEEEIKVEQAIVSQNHLATLFLIVAAKFHQCKIRKQSLPTSDICLLTSEPCFLSSVL